VCVHRYLGAAALVAVAAACSIDIPRAELGGGDANVNLDGASGDAPSDASIDAAPVVPIVTNGQPADLVLGVPDFTTVGGLDGISLATLSRPRNIASDGSRLWVVDADRHRVLQWEALPSANGQPANFVIGQLNGTGSKMGTGVTNLHLGQGQSGLAIAEGRLIISDTLNHRVHVRSELPTANGSGANLALGQNSANDAGETGTAASQLAAPQGVWSDGQRLAVADTGNNRVLVWNAFPIASGEGADVVLGQEAFGLAEEPSPPNASSMKSPAAVHFDGERFYVADSGNHRVLVWNGFPTTNGQAADYVLGQISFAGGLANAGNVNVSGATFNDPADIVVAHGALFVADSDNDRVLVFQPIPTVTGAAASSVLGQPTLTTHQVVFEPSQIVTRTASSVFAVGDKLFVSDSFNRVLRFDLNAE
jgi:hypothetical protein